MEAMNKPFDILVVFNLSVIRDGFISRYNDDEILHLILMSIRRVFCVDLLRFSIYEKNSHIRITVDEEADVDEHIFLLHSMMKADFLLAIKKIAFLESHLYLIYKG